MTERKYNTLAEEMEATGDIQIDSDESEYPDIGKTGSYKKSVAKNSDTSELSIHQVVGAIKYAEAIGAFNSVMQTVQLRRVQELYRENNPVALELAENFQGFCEEFDLDYKTVTERIRNLNTFGQQFLERAEQYNLPMRDLRRIKRLPDGKRREVIGLVMSGHSENEEVKDLVKDLLNEIEEKDEALHQAQNDLQEARTAEKVNLIEQRYTLESEKQDLQEELERRDRAVKDKDEQLQKYYALETANGKLQLAEDIQRRINTLTRDVQALDYDRNEATETLENMMEQIAAGINNLAEIINVHFLGE